MTVWQNFTSAAKGWAGGGFPVFCLAFVVYALTVCPTVSLWDSGEFVCCAAGLDVGHPPGAPLYWLVLRLAVLLFPAGREALACAMASAACCAAAAAVLSLCVRRLLSWAWPAAPRVVLRAAGFAAGMSWAVCGSVWAVAVETEVYGAAVLLGFLVLWLALRWRGGGSPRLLLLAAFVVGLQAGVHWLGWLLLPVSALVVGGAWGRRGALVGFLGGCVGVAALVWLASGGAFEAAAMADVLCVNVLGLPLGVGWGVLAVTPPATMLLVAARGRGLVASLCLGCFLVSLGFLTYALPLVRAMGGVAVSVSSPSCSQRLLDYMGRRQYGSRPLLHGPTYASRPDGVVSEPRMAFSDSLGRYEPSVEPVRYSYPSDQLSLFPRMTEEGPEALWAYRVWASPYGWPDSVPDLAANVRFFVSYQLGHMMARYVLWNFCGRQNDVIGDGGYAAGNFISGVMPLDRARLHLVEYDPPSSGRVALFGLPLLAAVVGLCLLFRRGRRRLLVVVGLWLLLCGPALAFYVNMPPFEPRERDYIFLPLYAAFCLGIGVSVCALCHRLMSCRVAPWLHGLLVCAVAASLPVLMCRQGWAASDRSGGSVAEGMAVSLLNLCPPDAIVITGGDNDTYPLWYAQQVLGHRRDVRVVNYGLLSADWHVASLLRPGRADAPLAMRFGHLTAERHLSGLYISPNGRDTLSLSDVREISTEGGDVVCCLPAANVQIPLADTSVTISPSCEWLGGQELMLLDIIASNPGRKICLLPGAVPEELGLSRWLFDVGPVAYLEPRLGRAEPMRLWRLLRGAVRLPDADRCPPSADEAAQLRRLCFRQMCARVADEALSHADTVAAREALTRSLAWMPPSVEPEDTALLQTATLLHRASMPGLARDVLIHVADRLSARLRWAAALRHAAPLASRSMRRGAVALVPPLIDALQSTGNADVAVSLADVVRFAPPD